MLIDSLTKLLGYYKNNIDLVIQYWLWKWYCQE